MEIAASAIVPGFSADTALWLYLYQVPPGIIRLLPGYNSPIPAFFDIPEMLRVTGRIILYGCTLSRSLMVHPYLVYSGSSLMILPILLFPCILLRAGQCLGLKGALLSIHAGVGLTVLFFGSNTAPTSVWPRRSLSRLMLESSIQCSIISLQHQVQATHAC